MAPSPGPRLARLWAIPLLAGCHGLAYEITAQLVPRRPASAFHDLATPLDELVPYLPWTWILYWSVYPFVIVGGTAILLPVSGPVFRRTLLAFLLLTALGPVFHNVIPSRAPWVGTEQLMPLQRAVHASPLVRPHANLPSMHVAFPALLTLIWATHSRSKGVRAGAVLTTLLIAVSTVTLKEHFVVDPLGGLALAGLVYLWWRGGPRFSVDFRFFFA